MSSVVGGFVTAVANVANEAGLPSFANKGHLDAFELCWGCQHGSRAAATMGLG